VSPRARLSRSRVLLVLVESGLLLAALALAALLFGELEAPPDAGPFLARALVAVLLLQVCFFYGELYDHRALRSRVQFFLGLGQAGVAAAVLLAVVYYLVPALTIPPATLVVAFPLAALLVFGWHWTHRWAAGREAVLDNVLILGTGPTAELITSEIQRREPMGYRIAGFLAEHPHEMGRPLLGVGIVGTAAELRSLVQALRIDLIVVALENRRGHLPVDELLQCRVAGVEVEDAPDFYERITGKILLSDLRPSWLVFSRGFNKPRVLSNVKRGLELVAAVGLLVLLAPLLGAMAILVRLDSPGPALLRQPRVGRRGRSFVLYKLRTMRPDAETGTGPVWTSPDGDPRVTRAGRILRRLRLDELPQLVNIVRGDMSFVGPRPERPHFVEQLRRVIPYYDERHAVRPGITGWAQVKFGYGSTIEDSECKLQFDLYYVKNMSLLLDAAILVDTLKVMLLGRGAR
jgi:sugar transferase (PEP-CTERM system associated)